jgi:hypothetical protein
MRTRELGCYSLPGVAHQSAESVEQCGVALGGGRGEFLLRVSHDPLLRVGGDTALAYGFHNPPGHGAISPAIDL